MYFLRNTENMAVPAFRTTIFRNSFPILSCRLYNKLPATIKNIQTINSFLKHTKKWLLEHNHIQIESLLQLQS